MTCRDLRKPANGQDEAREWQVWRPSVVEQDYCYRRDKRGVIDNRGQWRLKSA